MNLKPLSRYMDFDVDVGDIVFYKKLMALWGHDGAVVAREGSGNHTYPEDDGGERLFPARGSDAENVGAAPLHLHRIQKGPDFGTQIVFPDLAERVVKDWAEHLDLYRVQKGAVFGNYFGVPVPVERLVDGGTEFLQFLVRLRAGWHLPRSGAGASDRGRGGEQAGKIELGFQLGQRERKHTTRRGISYGEGTIGAKGFKKGHEMGGGIVSCRIPLLKVTGREDETGKLAGGDRKRETELTC